MKKIAKSLLALTATALVLFSTGCSNDSDDSSSSSGGSSSGSVKVTVPVLPASSGENVLSGKTLTETDSNQRYVFGDSTFTYELYDNSEWVKCEECAYTYDADKNLLSYYLVKGFDPEVTASDYYSVLSQFFSGTMLEYMDVFIAKWFSTMVQKTVSISDDNNTATLTNFFDGDVTKGFKSECDCFLSDDDGEFRSMGKTKDGEDMYFYPNFNTTDKTFSAACYLVGDETATKLGTAKGTYTTDEDSVTLTFTEFPDHTFKDTSKQIKTNTPYELSVYADPTEYTITEKE